MREDGDSLVLRGEQKDRPVLSALAPVGSVRLHHLLDAEAQALQRTSAHIRMMHEPHSYAQRHERSRIEEPVCFDTLFKLFTKIKHFYSNSFKHLPTLPSV